ncbi:MAG: zf-HC2 domain-containing protein [Desulfosalsimonadaceae bacterium]
MTNACKITSMISAFADGQLSGKDSARVVRHLEVCDVCREEYAAFRSINRLLCEVPDLTPSPGFDAGFWRKLGEMEKKKAQGPWFKWRDWGFRPAWAVAAATAMIVFGVLMYRQSPLPSPDEAGDAAGLLMAEDIELYDDFEIIQHIDLLEQWETISSMEEI